MSVWISHHTYRRVRFVQKMTDKQHILQRRRAILAAAQDAFDARGCEATTMDEIAEKAALAKGTLYNYFHSKEDLFLGVFVSAFADDDDQVQRLVDAPAPASEKLQRLMDYLFSQLQFYTRSGKLLMEMWATAARQQQEEGLAGSIATIHGDWRRRFRVILDEGIEAGQFGRHLDSRVVASLIWATINGIIVQAMFDTEAEIGHRSLATLKRGLLAGLTAWSDSGASD